MIRPRKWLTVAAALVPLAFSPVASAEYPLLDLGMLTCSVRQGSAAEDGDAPGEAYAVACRFRPAHNGPEETYSGTLTAAGTLREKGVIMLMVRGNLASKTAPGFLQQRFSAEGPIANGQQPLLVGDKRQSIVLRSAFEAGDRAMALGQPRPGLIIGMDLQLQSTPA